MIRFFILVAGAAALGWSVRRWREAVQVALVLVIFEGAIRKWLVPGAQDLIYFAKDVFLLGAYAGFFFRGGRSGYRLPPIPLLYGALGAATFFGVLEIFNPSLPNLAVGLLGFKSYFFYAPLLFVLPATFRNDAELAQALRRYLQISIPVGLLAIAQFFSPAGSMLNTYARSTGDATSIVTFGSSIYVRVTATFSFITGYTAYLLATSILLLAWLSFVRWRLRGSLDVFAALGLTLLGMLMTGSRGPILAFLLILPLYWYFSIVREKQSGATFLRLIGGLGLIAVLLQQVGSEAVTAFEGRAAGSGKDVVERIVTSFVAPFQILGETGPFGFGIGATHQAAISLTQGIPPFAWLRGMAVEAEPGRIMLELGPIGFSLVFFVRLFLVLFAVRLAASLRTSFHRALATASLVFLLAQVPSYVVFDTTSGIYYWSFAGLLMLALRLDREAVAWSAAAARTAASAPAPLQPAPAWPARSERP